MPSALFEMYQKNFDNTLKRLSGMIELYQNQTKEVQSITLKEMELNISEMERAISQMELEVILEKMPDYKKKLTKIIDNNKNIVKQYKREIQDLKYKEQSILNKKNLAYIPTNKKKKNTQLNFLKDETIIKNNFSEDEDTALFIDKNNCKKNNFDKYTINDITNDEMALKKDEAIKRINEHGSDSEYEIKNNSDIDLSTKKKQNKENDKDLTNNKYKLNKDNIFKKIIRIFFTIIQFLIAIIIAFFKNNIFKGYNKLKHHLVHKYGQANSRKIAMVLFIIGFIIIYSLIIYIWNSFKMRIVGNQIDNIAKENNETFLISKNETISNKTNNTSGNISDYN